LQFLCDTDEDFARAKTLYDALSEQKKTIQALEYGKLDGSAAEKTQKALASQEYRNHLGLIRGAQMDFETLRAKRITKQAVIDMWRSVNSAQKMGNV